MRRKYFAREMRTLGQVPRWAIVRLNREQSVLEHTALVTMYVADIAHILGYKGDFGALLLEALRHDFPEVCTGDLPSPVKKEISTPAQMDAYEQRVLVTRYGIDEGCPDSEMHQIVKLADILEATLKLTEELASGNRSVERLLKGMTEILFSAIDGYSDHPRYGQLRASIVNALENEYFGHDGIGIQQSGSGKAFWDELIWAKGL